MIHISRNRSYWSFQSPFSTYESPFIYLFTGRLSWIYASLKVTFLLHHKRGRDLLHIAVTAWNSSTLNTTPAFMWPSLPTKMFWLVSPYCSYFLVFYCLDSFHCNLFKFNNSHFLVPIPICTSSKHLEATFFHLHPKFAALFYFHLTFSLCFYPTQ